jgi:hypothetical protein
MLSGPDFNYIPIVSLRQELEEARAVTTTARASEEAGRQQLARMMDEQLAQTRTIEAFRRQVETSNTNQEHPSRITAIHMRIRIPT